MLTRYPFYVEIVKAIGSGEQRTQTVKSFETVGAACACAEAAKKDPRVRRLVIGMRLDEWSRNGGE